MESSKSRSGEDRRPRSRYQLLRMVERCNQSTVASQKPVRNNQSRLRTNNTTPNRQSGYNRPQLRDPHHRAQMHEIPVNIWMNANLVEALSGFLSIRFPLPLLHSSREVSPMLIGASRMLKTASAIAERQQHCMDRGPLLQLGRKLAPPSLAVIDKPSSRTHPAYQALNAPYYSSPTTTPHSPSRPDYPTTHLSHHADTTPPAHHPHHPSYSPQK